MLAFLLSYEMSEISTEAYTVKIGGAGGMSWAVEWIIYQDFAVYKCIH